MKHQISIVEDSRKAEISVDIDSDKEFGEIPGDALIKDSIFKASLNNNVIFSLETTPDKAGQLKKWLLSQSDYLEWTIIIAKLMKEVREIWKIK